jgi:hypothetical protein
MSLRKPIPPFPIPLRSTEAPIFLDLQPIVDRVYLAGGHDDIDYDQPPEPQLSEPDASWAIELLATRRR